MRVGSPRHPFTAAAALVSGVALPHFAASYLMPWIIGWPATVRSVLSDAGAGRVAGYASFFVIFIPDYVVACALGTAAAILIPDQARWAAVWAALGILLQALGWHVYLQRPGEAMPWFSLTLLSLANLAVIPFALLPTCIRRRKS